MPLVSTVHSTYVHHVALDPSGSLIATCSSDKTVNIFHRRHLSSLGDTDEWDLGSTIRDHSGPVVRLAWCHLREHGPMLATAGADRWIHIYRIVVSSHEGRPVIEAVRWTHARGFEKDAITDVAFIPPQQFHVLLLSTASLDGSVRLYEIQQPTFQLLCRHTPENDLGVDGMTGADESTPTTVTRPGMTASGGPSCSPSSIRGARSFPNSSPASAAPTGQGFEGVYRSNQRGCGVTTISWFPGATERTMTLAVGALSGKFFLYRFLKDQKTFAPIPLPASVGPSRCAAAVEVVAWAPAVGRRFNLLAVCSRVEVIILRLNCTSPSAVEGPIDFEVFRFHGGGAVSVTWSRSATMLYCVADSDAGTVSVLRMRDPLDHQSWEVVSEQGGEPTLS